MGLILEYIRVSNGLKRRAPRSGGFTSGQGKVRSRNGYGTGFGRQSSLLAKQSTGATKRSKGSKGGTKKRSGTKKKGLIANELDKFKYGNAGKFRRYSTIQSRRARAQRARSIRNAVRAGSADRFIQLSSGKLAGSRKG